MLPNLSGYFNVWSVFKCRWPVCVSKLLFLASRAVGSTLSLLTREYHEQEHLSYYYCFCTHYQQKRKKYDWQDKSLVIIVAKYSNNQRQILNGEWKHRECNCIFKNKQGLRSLLALIPSAQGRPVPSSATCLDCYTFYVSLHLNVIFRK